MAKRTRTTTNTVSREYERLNRMGFISLEEIQQEDVPAEHKQTFKPKRTKRTWTAEALSDNIPADLPVEWKKFNLDASLVAALAAKGFAEPTHVQKQVLPLALAGRDVIGCAPTGSGKTLAFALPILHYIVTAKTDDIAALIIAPTRELATQIHGHIRDMTKYINGVVIATVIGGMSVQKQERLLDSSPKIVVGTPGRLLELINTTDSLVERLNKIKYLVIDEADRMIERGHFKELADIFDELQLSQHQTLLFSATINDGNMQEFRRRIPFAQKQPDRISIDTLIKNLKNYKLICAAEDKDVFLFYYLKSLGTEMGRVLIFVNAISVLKHVTALLQLLGLPASSLHAQMQQRQRLKILDRFRGSEKMILVSSDVSSRGLDIISIQHVIQYQLPKQPETFVHRAGRTARANNAGTTLSLCSPEEQNLFLSVTQKFSLSSFSTFSVSHLLLQKLRKPVVLAKKILELEYTITKKSRWESKAAEELGVEQATKKRIIDDDGSEAQHQKQFAGQLRILKKNLEQSLL